MNISIFSSKINLNTGDALGGYGPGRFSVAASNDLEVNGISFTGADGHQYQLCSIDTLYAGRLNAEFSNSDYISIFAASHTHYAPMLDDNKPHIGTFSQTGFDAYVHTLRKLKRIEASPTRCRLYQSSVDVPIYRRFDYPDRWWNRILTRYFGFYPNEEKKIDKNIYIFEFLDEKSAKFVIVYHACHPVSRGNTCELSSDYVGEVRDIVRKKFNVETVLFLQGCAGDVRPNLAHKRINFLPKFRLNWKFNYHPSAQETARVNESYRHAILAAMRCRDIALGEDKFNVFIQKKSLADGKEINITTIRLSNNIEFVFLPFEVSHLYHSVSFSSKKKLQLIVSCANDTLGYLSHPVQHRAGGYEVYGSLNCMGLKEKIKIKE